MEIINNKYRIIEKIKEYTCYASYLVSDLNNEKELSMFNIIKSNNVAPNILKSYFDDINFLSRIKTSNINEIKECGLVENIDGKWTSTKQYYYICAYNKNIVNIDKLNNINYEELLDMFVEVCQSINLLHIKKINYGYLKFDNINLICREGKKHKLLLIDMFSAKLNQYELDYKEDHDIFGTNLVKCNDRNKKDICNLGVLLISIINRTTDVSVIKEIIYNGRNDIGQLLKDGQVVYNKIIKIAIDMVYGDKFKNIDSLIKEINTKLNKNYDNFRKEEINRLNFDLDLIGRKDELQSICDAYNEFKQEKSTKSICVIYGEEGIGKSKILNEFKMYLKENFERVFDDICMLKVNKIRDINSFLVILRKVINECPTEILDKYRDTISDVLSGFDTNEVINRKDMSGMYKERLRFINRVGAFLGEYCKYKPITIIIDDMHEIDDLTMDIVKYLCSLDSKIFIVMSYSHDRNNVNLEFEKWINEVDVRPKILKVNLKYIQQENVNSIISQVLLTPKIPHKISKIINERAKGNPLFIIEVIKDLFIRKIIYVNDNGQWILHYKNEELSIPRDMKEALIGQLNAVSDEERKALEFLSVFKNCTYSNIIDRVKRSIFIGEIDDYMSLDKKRIISITYSDDMFKVDFYNRFLKLIVKESLSKEQIIHFSDIISREVEILFNQGQLDLLEELIYQLETIKDNERLIVYYIKYSLLMMDRKSKGKALKYLKKALGLYEYNKVDINKIDIYYNMGLIYLDEGRIHLAESMFNSAVEICIETHNEVYNLKVLDSLVDVYIGKKDTYNLKYALDKIEDLIGTSGNLDYRIQFGYIKALYESFNYNYEKSIEICLDSLGKIPDGFEHIKANLYNSMAFSFMELNKPEEAIKNLEKCISNGTVSNNYRALYKGYNNYGVIYGDFYQDYETAILYIKRAREIADKNNLLVYLIRTKNNLGSIYLSNHQYEDSIKELREVEQLIPNDDIYEYVYTNVIMCRSNMAMENINSALRSYNIVNQYHERNLEDEHCRNIMENFLSMIEFNLWVKDIDKAEKDIIRLEKLNLQDDSLSSIYISIHKQIINLMNNKNIKQSIDEINIYMSKLNNVCDLTNLIIKISKVFIFNNKIDELRKLVSKYEDKIRNRDLKPLEQAKITYVMSFMEDDIDIRENILKHAIKLCRNNNLKETYYMATMELCNIYKQQGKYHEADICYIIAFKAFKEFMKNISTKHLIGYINVYGLKDVFNDLNKINQFFYNGECKDDELKIYKLVQREGCKACTALNKNKKFIEIAKNIYNAPVGTHSNRLSGILNKLEGDDYKNLSILSKYLNYNFLADRTLIIANTEDGYQVLHSSNDNTEIDIKAEELIQKARNARKMIKDHDSYDSMRACIPILVTADNIVDQMFVDRRKHIGNTKILVGYIYVETDCIFNNYIEKNVNKYKYINNLIGVIIDKINLKNSAFYDKLTGALTRKYLDTTLKDTLENSRATKEEFCVLMLDFDKFKLINDNYGHQVGDEVLKKASNIIKSRIRKTDILGRYGGEELMVVIPNQGKETGVCVGEKLRKAVEQADILEGKSKVTISVGVVSYPEDGESISELVERSDKSLYIAKSKGRNKVIGWNNDFKNDVKGSNYLSGIVINSFMQEEKHFFTMVDIIGLIKESRKTNDKIEAIFRKIVDIVQAEVGYLFLINNNNILTEFKQINEYTDKKACEYNKKILQQVIDNKKGMYSIDWDNIDQIDRVTNLPDWKSIIVTPIIYSGNVVAVIYLSVATKVKEFTYEDFNIVNLLGSISTPVFIESINNNILEV